jgi:hypothetical protein
VLVAAGEDLPVDRPLLPGAVPDPVVAGPSL